MRGVLCSGSLIHDTLVRPADEIRWGGTTFVETIESHPGGNGANTSLALARLGVPVRVLGTVGRDPQGGMVLERLRAEGADITAVAYSEEPTAATVALVRKDGSRGFLHRLGASRTAFAQPVAFTATLTEGYSHYHMASLFILPALRNHAAEMLQVAREAGLTTSLDTNWDPEGRWMQVLQPCLPHLDYLFMNEDEARLVTGTANASEGARRVRELGVRIAVMKLGPEGCLIQSATEELRCPAFPVAVKDTTGAGDSFVAGFFAALHRGAPLEDAGRFANAVGAMSVQSVGAVAGVRNYEQTLAWMRGR